MKINYTKLLYKIELLFGIMTILCYANVIHLNFYISLTFFLLPIIFALLIYFITFIYFVYKLNKPIIVNLYLRWELQRIKKAIDKIEKEL